MNPILRQRLFSPEAILEDSVTLWTIGILATILILAPALAILLHRLGWIGDKLHGEILVRWRSWLVLSGLMLTPIVLGPFWVMMGVLVLSLLCYREFARATGVFREKAISIAVVFGILLVAFAVLDHFTRLFFASAALTVGILAMVTIPLDKPKGYLQRTALGTFGFLLFGYCLGYLGLIANSPQYRPILIKLLLGVEMNDVFAFCSGKLIGGPKAIPNTSPGKTRSGCIGALILTTLFVATMGHFVFAGTPMDRLDRLLFLGAGLSFLGQFGDLILSSIKRDVGVKDIGDLIPGHGGMLDRFDSLVLVPPAAFHYLSLILGPLGAEQAQRIFTGGGG